MTVPNNCFFITKQHQSFCNIWNQSTRLWLAILSMSFYLWAWNLHISSHFWPAVVTRPGSALLHLSCVPPAWTTKSSRNSALFFKSYLRSRATRSFLISIPSQTLSKTWVILWAQVAVMIIHSWIWTCDPFFAICASQHPKLITADRNHLILSTKKKEKGLRTSSFFLYLRFSLKPNGNVASISKYCSDCWLSFFVTKLESLSI